ncbi:MAG: lysophospholipid acyltransferase family protein [Pseudomonadota bacterium]
MATWNGADPPVVAPPRSWQRVVGVFRGLAMFLGTLPLYATYVLGMRLLQRIFPSFQSWRVTKRLWGRWCLWCFGVRLEQRGTPMQGPGALVVNHATWLDIIALMGTGPLCFVAKAEVRHWPIVGPMAAYGGTLFIERKSSEAKRQAAALKAALDAPERLTFFPEGTSTDGRRVLEFKSSLFGMFFEDDVPAGLHVQPATVVYRPPAGQPEGFFGWWADMPFFKSVWDILCQSWGARVVIVLHPPLAAADFADRKALAAAAGEAVRGGMAEVLGHPVPSV